MRYELRLKILLLSAAAPAVLGPAAIWFVNRSVTAHVRSTIDDSLRSAALVCENGLIARTRAMQASADVVGQDPRFFSALTLPGGAGDPHFRRTIEGVARDFNRIAKADLFEVLDSRGQIIASVGRRAATKNSRNQCRELTQAGHAVSAVIVGADGQIYQAVARPVLAGKRVVGILAVGLVVGDDLAHALEVQTRSQISFIAGDKVTASSIEGEDDQRALVRGLAGVFPAGTAVPPSAPAIMEIKGGSETSLALARPFQGAVEGSRLLYVVQRSLADKTAFETTFLIKVQGGLGKLGAIIIIVAMVFGLILSHHITRPILSLVRGAEEMEQGNYEYPLNIRTQDEIGYLADRFREMREHQRTYVNSLKEAARLKSEFLTVATHELRTPFSIIKAYSELLSNGSMGQVRGGQKEALDVIEVQLKGIEQIIEDASWIAQIESEDPILKIEECEVRAMVDAALETATADATEREHIWLIEIAADVGTAFLDGPRFGQAIAHLVRNAIRFTPDGGRIRVLARSNGGYLIIQVEDSGIGIAEDKKEHLFDRSFMLRDSLQHHSSRTLEFNSAGLGLGLPLARGIVEAHGGAIEVESDPGRGSTFTVTVPCDARSSESLESLAA